MNRLVYLHARHNKVFTLSRSHSRWLWALCLLLTFSFAPWTTRATCLSCEKLDRAKTKLRAATPLEAQKISHENINTFSFSRDRSVRLSEIGPYIALVIEASRFDNSEDTDAAATDAYNIYRKDFDEVLDHKLSKDAVRQFKEIVDSFNRTMREGND